MMAKASVNVANGFGIGAERIAVFLLGRASDRGMAVLWQFRVKWGTTGRVQFLFF